MKDGVVADDPVLRKVVEREEVPARLALVAYRFQPFSPLHPPRVPCAGDAGKTADGCCLATVSPAQPVPLVPLAL